MRFNRICSVLLASILIIAFTFSVGAQEKPIKIGTVLPLSGDFATYGPPLLESARLAATQFNEAGGILGREIKIVSRDNKSDPTSGVDAAKKLINVDKVQAIIGALGSGISMPIAESAVIPAKVIQVSLSTTPLLTDLEDDDYIFRTIASDKYVGVMTGQLALDLGYDSITVIYVNNAYGEGIATAAVDWYKKQGGNVVSFIPYNMGKSSYKSELSQATKKNSDALLLIAHKEYGSVILRQAFQGGYVKKFNENFIFSSSLKTSEVVEAIGAKYLQGTHGTAAGAKETPTRDIFKKSFEKEYGRSPATPYMEHAYDAGMVLGLAIQHAGEYSSAALRDSLRAVANPPGEKIYGGVDEVKKAIDLLKEGKDINYQGAASEVTFNQNGDIVTPVLIWKINENGEFVEVRSEELEVVNGKVVPADTVEE